MEYMIWLIRRKKITPLIVLNVDSTIMCVLYSHIGRIQEFSWVCKITPNLVEIRWRDKKSVIISKLHFIYRIYFSYHSLTICCYLLIGLGLRDSPKFRKALGRLFSINRQIAILLVVELNSQTIFHERFFFCHIIFHESSRVEIMFV